MKTTHLKDINAEKIEGREKRADDQRWLNDIDSMRMEFDEAHRR